MIALRCGVLAAVLMGIGWTLGSGAAYSDNSTAVRQADMRKVCIEHGGRFERSWLYNDRGVQWGEVLSCATRAGSVTCKENVCRSRRSVRTGGATVPADRRNHNVGAVGFPAEPIALAEALSALAAN